MRPTASREGEPFEEGGGAADPRASGRVHANHGPPLDDAVPLPTLHHIRPPAVEKYTADQSAVIQLLGKDEVVWVDGGTAYHVCDEVSDIQTGNEKRTGTTAQAVEAGKSRLTLKFASELRACGLVTPENTDEIEVALRSIQGGAVDAPLPAPVWADPEDAPISVEEAPPHSHPAVSRRSDDSLQ